MALPKYCITLEEHATLPSLGDECEFYTGIWKTYPAQREYLRDLSNTRLADMDAGHVSLQVMSALPGMSSINPLGCSGANDEMAEAIKANPKRFRGFAALPMQYPDQAAAELERAVTKLGLCGAMIDDHLEDGTHYVDEKFWPVFETAQRLDVPIYLHPTPATGSAVKSRFDGPWDDVVTRGLMTGAWGWHEYTGLHIIKLFAAGLFKKYPKLKIIIGHNGEMLPMMIDRIDDLTFFRQRGLGRFSEVWDTNIWVTSSGMFTVRMLEMLLKVTSIDKVMYSVDYPFKSNTLGWSFAEALVAKGSLSAEEMDKFMFGNASKLLKISL